jgi:hypothetical protein
MVVRTAHGFGHADTASYAFTSITRSVTHLLRTASHLDLIALSSLVRQATCWHNLL